MERFEGQGKRGFGGGMKSPTDICRANAQTERAKRDSDRAAMRARFPFAAEIVAELVAAGFKPRVMAMSENGNEWRRA